MSDVRRTVRFSPAEDAWLDELCRVRKLRRSDVLRALVSEEHRRLAEGLTTEQVELVDDLELHQILSASAREGNIGAMRELRMLLAKPAGEAGGRSDASREKGATADGFDALDELAPRREARAA